MLAISHRRHASMLLAHACGRAWHKYILFRGVEAGIEILSEGCLRLSLETALIEGDERLASTRSNQLARSFGCQCLNFIGRSLTARGTELLWPFLSSSF